MSPVQSTQDHRAVTQDRREVVQRLVVQESEVATQTLETGQGQNPKQVCTSQSQAKDTETLSPESVEKG